MKKGIRAVILVSGIALSSAGVAVGLCLSSTTPEYQVNVISELEDAEFFGQGKYKVGKTVEIRAEEVEGYRFMNWILPDGETALGNPYTFKLTNKNFGTYIAVFEKEFNITLQDNYPNGHVFVNKTKAITGEEVEIEAISDEHCSITQISYSTVSGTTILQPDESQENIYKFNMPDDDIIINVSFEATIYSINLGPAINGSIQLSKYSGIYGDEILVTDISPELGYALTRLYYVTEGNTQENLIIGNRFVLQDNMTVYSQFDLAVYTIKFVDDDGSIISQNTYYYDDEIEVPADPSKESDGKYTYTFAGWDKEISKATGDKIYTATYTAELIDYNISIPEKVVVNNGEIENNDIIHYGDILDIRYILTEGYRLKTFEVSGANLLPNEEYLYEVVGNVSIIFEEQIRVFEVKFFDENNNLLYTDSVEFDETASYGGETPTKASDNIYYYTFEKWVDLQGNDAVLTNIQENKSVYAKYSSDYIEYEILFVDEDDSEISRQNYHYGQIVVIPLDPSKESDGRYHYTFAGWDSEVSPVDGNKTYRATYNAILREYTIKFVDEDGSLISSNVYHFEDDVVPPADPSKESDGDYEYFFAGWDSEIVPVDGDKTYTATYSSQRIEYTITIPEKVVVNSEQGEVTSQDTLHYGDIIQIDYNLTEGYEVDSFSVTGVQNVLPGSNLYKVTGNVVIVFTEKIKVFEVKFFNENNDLLFTDNVEYNDTAIYEGETPTKASDNTYHYTFDKWIDLQGNDAVLSNIQENKNVYAKYSRQYVEYIVLFVDEDDSEISRTIYHYGQAVTTPTTPTKASDERYDYTFAGWDSEVVPVDGDKTYKATYSQSLREYTIKFVNDSGALILQAKYHYEDEIEEPQQTPTKASDNTYNYTFAGWDSEITQVYGDKTYTATYTPSYIEYTLSFPSNVTIRKINDSVEDLTTEDTVHYGDELEITYQETPGYTMSQFEVSGAILKSASVYEVRGNIQVTYEEDISHEDVYNSILLFTVTNQNSKQVSVKADNSDIEGDIFIPSKVKKTVNGETFVYDVTSIENYGFVDCHDIISINIPESIRTIGVYAFAGCNYLEYIENGDYSGWIQTNDLSNLEAEELVINSSDEMIQYLTSTYLNRYWMRLVIDEQFKYIVNNNDEAIIYAKDNLLSGVIEIPSQVVKNDKTFTVNKIGKEAFKNCASITEIIIPNSIIKIGDGAFNGCSSLEQINIPSTITNIGNYMFASCSALENIELPEETFSIGSYAFNGCSSLINITIPQNVQSIGQYAFGGCTGLENVTFEDEEGWFVATKAGDTSGTDVTLDNTATNVTLLKTTHVKKYWLKSIVQGSLRYFVNSQGDLSVYALSTSLQGEIEIPSSIEYKGENYNVTEIGSKGFYNCSKITNLIIPEGIVSIGDSALYSCKKITSLTIPSTVTTIKSNAMYFCTTMQEILFANVSTLESIGDSAFYGCKALTEIEIPSSVTTIGDYAFQGCDKMFSIKISSSAVYSGLTSVGAMGQILNSAEKVYVQKNIYQNTNTYFENELNYTKTENESYYIFTANVLSYIYDESSKTAIVTRNANVGTPNGELIIPASVTKNNQEYMVITIQANAFSTCKNITSVTIAESISIIEPRAFENCINLTSVVFEDTEGWFSASSDSATSGTTLNLTNAETNAQNLTNSTAYWKKAIVLGDFKYIIAGEGCVNVYAKDATISGEKEIPSSIEYRGETYIVNKIGSYAFNACSGLTKITIPASITQIESYAFYNCTGLENVVFAENSNLTNIGDSSFYNCSSLTEIDIPNSVTSIGIASFRGCSSLEEINILQNMTNIGKNAFLQCSSLTAINVNENNQIYSSTDGVLFDKNHEFLIYMPAAKAGEEYQISADIRKINISAFADTTYANISFEDASGWFVASNATTATGDILSLDDTEDNVTLLKTTYQNKYWLKNIVIDNCKYALDSENMIATVYALSNDIEGDLIIQNIITFKGQEYAVTTIAENAFENCTGITSLFIPANITSIQYTSFNGCVNMKTVTIESEEVYKNIYPSYYLNYATLIKLLKSIDTSEGNYYLKEDNFTITEDDTYYIYTPIYFTFTYNTSTQTATIWKNGSLYTYTENLVIPSTVEIDGVVYTVTEIASFSYNDDIKTIFIPATVIKIRDRAFWGCDGIESVTFEDTNNWYQRSTNASTGSRVYVTNPTTNATYLRTTYVYKVWYKQQ